jgi:hypothetical protein
LRPPNARDRIPIVAAAAPLEDYREGWGCCTALQVAPPPPTAAMCRTRDPCTVRSLAWPHSHRQGPQAPKLACTVKAQSSAEAPEAKRPEAEAARGSSQANRNVPHTPATLACACGGKGTRSRTVGRGERAAASGEMATPVPLAMAEGWLWFYGLVHVLPHAQVLYAKMHADEVLHRAANMWTLGRVCSAAAFIVYYAFLKLQVRIAPLPNPPVAGAVGPDVGPPSVAAQRLRSGGDALRGSNMRCHSAAALEQAVPSTQDGSMADPHRVCGGRRGAGATPRVLAD